MMVRLLIVLALLFLSRVFFYLFNIHYFSGLSFFELLKIFFIGLRFDISALIIINAPYIFFNIIPFRFKEKKIYQGILNGYFFLINTVALAGNFIDLIYFRFTLKRTTADIFSYLGVGGDFGQLVPQFIHDFWYILILWIVFIFLLVFLFNRFRVKRAGKSKARGGGIKYYLIQTLLFLVILFVSIIGIRGGFQLRPISLITAGNYTSAKNVPLLLNTPFSIVKTINKQALPTIRFYKKEGDLHRIYSPVHKGIPGSFRKNNIVIIILESFSREHIGSLNKGIEHGNYTGFTPFLDSLIDQSLVYKAFANGKTSIQGIPCILSSIPSMMNESYIQSTYAGNKVSSIASLLKAKGYTTAFFHGGTNGTMGFDSYTRMVAFDHYYGRSEYNNENDYDGKWGIRDEEFFQFTAKTLNTLKQPFVISIFSLSSHHPYIVPKKYENLFREGHLPIQKSIMYTDFSLNRFFETVKKMSWFDNALFVITADHTSEGYFPYYQSDAGQYAVPIIFYMHNSALRGKPDIVAQQIDIMPTILSYLGYDRTYIAFGSNLLDPEQPHFSVHYISGLYGLIKDDYLLEFNGDHTTGLYNLRTDTLQRKNLIKGDIPTKNNLEIFMKAFIQQYNNRIIENRLTID